MVDDLVKLIESLGSLTPLVAAVFAGIAALQARAAKHKVEQHEEAAVDRCQAQAAMLMNHEAASAERNGTAPVAITQSPADSPSAGRNADQEG